MENTKLELALIKWRSCLGADKILESEKAMERFSTDTSCAKRKIAASLSPSTVSEVREIVRIAGEYSVHLYPVSTGRNWGYGAANPVLDNCVILYLAGLNRIRMLDPELGLVTVEAGVTQEQLKTYLDERGLNFMVPTTGSGPNCSLLGNIMERGIGITPHCDHFEAVTSVEAVLPDGSLYQPALTEMDGELANQAFKWGIGPYLDGMFTQSGFGIVTAITFILAPKPDCVEAFYFQMTDDKFFNSVNAVRSILRDLPGIVVAINLMNKYRLLSTLGDFPKDLVPEGGVLSEENASKLREKHHLPDWLGMSAIYCPGSFRHKARREIRKRLSVINSRPIFMSSKKLRVLINIAKLIPGKHGAYLLNYLKNLNLGMDILMGNPNEVALQLCYWRSGKKPANGNLNPANDGCGLIWYMVLVPMKKDIVIRYTEMVKRICFENGIEPLITLTTLSQQCFESTVPILFDREDKDALHRARKCYDALFEGGKKLGVLPNRLSIEHMHYFEELAPNATNLIRRLHNAIDPERIISPGRYGA